MKGLMKSCPFCGIEIQSDGYGHHKDDCYIRVRFYSKPKIETEIKAWQNRPIEDTLNQRIKELESQVATLCPVGDLIGFPAWQVEKQDFMERIAELEADNKLFLEAASGRGMVSEMSSMEAAAVLVCGLHDRISEIARALNTCPEHILDIINDWEEKLDRLEEALEEIVNWSNAYPLDMFPESDFKKVRELLEAGGITLDAVSASNMRYVVEQVGKIAKDALKVEK